MLTIIFLERIIDLPFIVNFRDDKIVHILYIYFTNIIPEV